MGQTGRGGDAGAQRGAGTSATPGSANGKTRVSLPVTSAAAEASPHFAVSVIKEATEPLTAPTRRTPVGA